MRLKIIAGNLALVLLVGVASYLMVREDLRVSLGTQVDARIRNDAALFERSYRLSVMEFLSSVTDHAGARQARDVFAGLDEASRRTRAFELAEALANKLRETSNGRYGMPDIVAVTDETGTVLARNGGRNLMFGQSLRGSLPALAEVLEDGQPRHDAWRYTSENKVLQVGVAPIVDEGQTLLGALVVGYDLSNGVAAREAGILGREVAFVVDDSVYSASLSGEAMRSLNDHLQGVAQTPLQKVLSGASATSDPWRAPLLEEEFVGIAARLPAVPSVPVAYVVLGNRSQQMLLAGAVDTILYLLVLAALLVLAYGFAIGTSLLRQIERVEDGVLAVINGNSRVRIGTDDAELGGLAYRINQLLNVLSGTEEQDEMGRLSRPPNAAAWQASELDDSAAADVAGGADAPLEDPTLAQQLAAEDEEAYHARIYREYVEAKGTVGEDVSNIPQQRFVQRLEANAAALAQQHACRMVRFQVHTRANQVALRPVIIR